MVMLSWLALMLVAPLVLFAMQLVLAPVLASASWQLLLPPQLAPA